MYAVSRVVLSNIVWAMFAIAVVGALKVFVVVVVGGGVQMG